MGLLDQVLGNVMGSRQAGTPAAPAGSSMSPVTKALLLFLAAKAYQQYRAHQAGKASETPAGAGAAPSAQSPSDGLGGLFGGGAAPGGSLLGSLATMAGAGGLGALVERFARGGQGDALNSWIGTGPNQQIAPNKLAEVLGPEAIDQLAQNVGMPRDQMLAELSNELPQAVDQLTPMGRLPDDQELKHML